MKTLISICLLITSLTSVISQSCSKTKKCDTYACCSQWGNCGYGPDFCGAGCLNDCGARPECGPLAINPECPLKVCCGQWGFCGNSDDFCGAGCQGNCQNPPPPSCSLQQTELYNIGYYASWSSSRICNPFTVQNIDPRNYTHLNYAFGEISNGVMIIPEAGSTERELLDKFSALKEINTNLKVLISVGGWAFNDPGPTQSEFHNIISSASTRNKFIQSVSKFLETLRFDGIDIDYEYPAADDRGGFPEDTDNYVKLVEDMRAFFGTSKLITIAAPASYWYLRHFKIGAMSKYLDWINVMTYDIHGVWDADIQSLGPYVRSHTDIKEIETGIALFRKDGVPDNKIVLGLGYYGRSFTLKSPSCGEIGCEFVGPSTAGECSSPGTMAWFEISKIITEQKLTPRLDTSSLSKILTYSSDQWVAYDDDETLGYKTDWAKKRCLRGVMIWSIDQGLDRVKDDDALARYGSVNLARIHMKKVDHDGIPSSWMFTSTKNSLNGFDTFVLTTDGALETETVVNSREMSWAIFSKTNPIGIQSSDDHNRCMRNVGIPGIVGTFNLLRLWYLNMINQRGNNNSALGSVHMLSGMDLNEPDNPINLVFQRRIGNSRRQPIYRTELLEAQMNSTHFRDPTSRTDFSGPFIYNHLDGIRGMDDRGHILASSIGGLAGCKYYYNLTPQYWRINQHTSYTDDWVSMESAVRSHLRGNSGIVNFRVHLTYDDTLTVTNGRPISFTYLVELAYWDGRSSTWITLSIDNRDPTGVNRPRPRDLEIDQDICHDDS